MSILAKEGGSPRELLPTGNVQAVCYGVIELGHREGLYGVKHEACVLFEIPSLRYEDENKVDNPKGINKFYSISLHKDSNMCKDLTSWRGVAFTDKEKEGFDITKLIGANCLLNISHVAKKDKSMRDNIASITPLMAGMNKLEPENEIVNYSISDNGFVFDGVPEWAVKFIKESVEFKTHDNPPAREDNEPLPQDSTDYGIDPENIPF
jgi:hypothetical protein